MVYVLRLNLKAVKPIKNRKSVEDIGTGVGVTVVRLHRANTLSVITGLLNGLVVSAALTPVPKPV